MAQVRANSKALCDSCRERYGDNHCIECEQIFCDICRTLHLRAKVCQHHTFYTTDEIIMFKIFKCEKHKRDSTFVCMKCDKPVCTSCKIHDHGKHRCVEFKESCRLKILEAEKRLKTNFEVIRHNLQKIEEGKVTLPKEIETIIRSLDNQSKLIRELTHRVVHSNISKVRETQRKISKYLSYATQAWNKLLEIGNEHQDNLANVNRTDRKVNFELVKKIDDLKNDIQHMLDDKNLEIPSIKYERKDVALPDVQKLFGSLSISDDLETTTDDEELKKADVQDQEDDSNETDSEDEKFDIAKYLSELAENNVSNMEDKERKQNLHSKQDISTLEQKLLTYQTDLKEKQTCIEHYERMVNELHETIRKKDEIIYNRYKAMIKEPSAFVEHEEEKDTKTTEEKREQTRKRNKSTGDQGESALQHYIYKCGCGHTFRST